MRRRNFIKSFPHQTPVIMAYDAGDYHASLKKAVEVADVKGFGKRKREAARHGKLRGLGYSTYIEACGIAPSQAVGSLGAGVGLWESAEVRVNPTGSVEVLTGCHAHGQGHETTFAQLVSERLGIPFENVSIVHGDTDKVQFGMGTYGSRSGAVGMSAIVKALDKIEAKAKKVAAFMLEAAEGDIEFKDGKFTVAGTDKSAAFGDVALNAYIAHKFTGAELEPGLKETSFYDPTNFTFPAGCHICEVEVDADTGKTEIVNWTAVDDFGTVINPMIVEGQVHGGIAQGVGQALHGRRGLQQRGPARDRLDDGLHHAARARSAVVPRRADRNQVAVESARHQGLRRGRRHCRARRGDQRHYRRDRNRKFGHAGDRQRGVDGAARRQTTPSCLIRRERCTISPSIVRPRSARRPACLARNPEAKLLAGGHSLIPVMKQRLASPSALIDLSLVEGMTGVEQKGRSIVIGAMTRHADAANSPVLQQALPGLASVPASVGDPQVRNRGTIGGSIANNDPNADYPAACLGLGATIITNKRRIAADDFFTGMFSTALEEGEIITRISFPIAKKAAYEKFKHPASGFALVGVFVSKRGSDIRVAVTGAGSNGVFRVKSFEEALKKRFAAKSLEGMSIPATGMNSDIHASPEYRAHLVGVLARRAVAKATA